MATNAARRRWLKSAAACLLAAPNVAFTHLDRSPVTLLGAWRHQGEDYVGLWDANHGARGVQIPYRAHEVLQDPGRRRSVIAIARRPGEFLARVDLDAMRVTTLRMIHPQFVANGHAVLSNDATTLLVAENDALTGEGFIAVYDADSLECRDRYPTAGIGPHALMREHDDSLLVA